MFTGKKEKANKENKNRKKGKKKAPIMIAVLFVVLLIGFGAWVKGNPRVKLLLSIVHFTESTMKSPSYMLYNVDIMEVFSDYFNGETQVDGCVGLSKLRDLPASMSIDMQAVRSMEKKEFSSNSSLNILFIEAGEVNYYAKNEIFYIEAPMLGDDFGYAFPTGINLFPKMPELTTEFSREWFHDNYPNIVKLMTEIEIEETGKSYTSEDGVTGNELKVTIPKGYGHFIWELLGMEDPDYDVVTSIYLTKALHMSRMEISLEDVLPGAMIVVDGEAVGKMIFTYDLPDHERMEMVMERNPKHDFWVDCRMSYYTNVDTIYEISSYITWERHEDGADLSVKDLLVNRRDLNDEKYATEGELLAKGYFKGTITKREHSTIVLSTIQDRLDTYETIEWRTVRNDTDVFVQGIMNKIKGKDENNSD